MDLFLQKIFSCLVLSCLVGLMEISTVSQSRSMFVWKGRKKYSNYQLLYGYQVMNIICTRAHAPTGGCTHARTHTRTLKQKHT